MSDVYDFLGYNCNKTPPFAQGFRLCTAALLRAGADPELRNEGNGAALSRFERVMFGAHFAPVDGSVGGMKI